MKRWRGHRETGEIRRRSPRGETWSWCFQTISSRSRQGLHAARPKDVHEVKPMRRTSTERQETCRTSASIALTRVRRAPLGTSAIFRGFAEGKRFRRRPGGVLHVGAPRAPFDSTSCALLRRPTAVSRLKRLFRQNAWRPRLQPLVKCAGQPGIGVSGGREGLGRRDDLSPARP